MRLAVQLVLVAFHLQGSYFSLSKLYLGFLLVFGFLPVLLVEPALMHHRLVKLIYFNDLGNERCWKTTVKVIKIKVAYIYKFEYFLNNIKHNNFPSTSLIL